MKDEDYPIDVAQLRARATAALGRKIAVPPEYLDTQTPGANRKLLEELRVFQIELEMQNQELRQAQVELDLSRARYIDLYDLAPVGYVTVSEAGIILQANFTMANLLGVTRSEVVKQRITNFIEAEDQDGYYLLRKQILATGESQSCELRLMRPSGPTCWVHLAATIAPCEGGRTELRIVLSDITDRRQAQQERNDFEREMQETQKLESLGVLAGGIAHDFNNILTGILGSTDLATRELPPDSRVRIYLQSINESSTRAAHLCKQMLAYSGRGRFLIERVDLSQLVETTAQMLRVSINKKALLRFHLEPSLPVVEADATQLRQIVMNLVINASEALCEESGVIDLTTGVADLDPAEFEGVVVGSELACRRYVYLEVADNGCGMTAATHARLFDPFFTTKFTGRGLGLAAVLGIVRGHGGTIKVDSVPGSGATFRILFPAQSGVIEAPTRQPPAERRLGRQTVLVVDDEESVRTVASHMLELSGFDSVVVADGRQAVELFRADPNRFDLVLLDLTMPKMDGQEIFKQLRLLRADLPVVIMSGYSENDAILRFDQKGVARFLQKPFTVDQMRATLQSLMRQ
ncbi:MAG: two-component system cell cycle sensor histidine kinase/response regulator CckA [Planctomycetota bacterium]|jgi:two-component system cell cycle sensor histidine kinase/response regulator CckA